MTLFDYSPGQQLTAHRLLYTIHECDPQSVTFSVYGLDGGSVKVISRKQFDRLMRDAEIVSPAASAAHATVRNECEPRR